MTTLIRRHPVASYFVLAILISWGGIAAIVAPTTMPAPAAEAQQLFVWVYLAMLAGPSLAGLAVTSVIGGRHGLREFRKRLFRWRVEGKWYLVALLTAPVTLLTTLIMLSAWSAEFLPALLPGNTDAAGPLGPSSVPMFILTGLLVGIGAGFFEELGWTGLAVPRMLRRHGILATGVLVGLVWGLWHLVAIWWGSADAIGSTPVTLYLTIALFSFLPPYRVLMAWMYSHTRSLFMGILMHMSLTSSMLVLGAAVSGRELLIFNLAFGSVLWFAAGVVVFAERRRHLPSHLVPAT